ncbi:glutathionylspermidine synthase family protein [Zymobacter palmae]|uniref:Glutathionylspermidine synthase n=1 Tax=Zymobacter palmae TaxID=33074 RepID=A0A348HES1_9GAMM|nr:glutathionylspermidine synthase family protein [Zymobacter palmae]BBG30123.1 glutathionylspermidine synthase [Zymobacter palmae]
MQRITLEERPDWQQTAHAMGFDFHTIDGERYWDERACYRFSNAQIDVLDTATQSIHDVCLAAVERVVNSDHLLEQLQIPARFHSMIKASWARHDPHLYGRMDFSFDGTQAPKLLELNYDTPTSLLESAAFQLVWLEQRIAQGALPNDADQFNLVAQYLAERFAELPNRQVPFYFAAIGTSAEDRGTTEFLRRMAEQVGIQTRHIDVEDIGLTAEGVFVDLDEHPIKRLFKLHPWEFIFAEPFGKAVPASNTQFFEPAWKAILSNKGILPILWEMAPNHPNLLPSYTDGSPESPVPAGWVRKPYLSREGANVTLQTSDGVCVAAEGPYTDSAWILQELAPLPRFGDSYTLIGSWVVGDRAAGISIREDNSLITRDSSRFLPHFIYDQPL